MLKDFQDKIKDYQFPDAYEITYGGENEQNQESVLSIIRAYMAAFILIISTLVIQFNSFKKAAIVLATIPLALIGVFFGLSAASTSICLSLLLSASWLCSASWWKMRLFCDKHFTLNLKSGDSPLKTRLSMPANPAWKRFLSLPFVRFSAFSDYFIQWNVASFRWFRYLRFDAVLLSYSLYRAHFLWPWLRIREDIKL